MDQQSAIGILGFSEAEKLIRNADRKDKMQSFQTKVRKSTQKQTKLVGACYESNATFDNNGKPWALQKPWIKHTSTRQWKK